MPHFGACCHFSYTKMSTKTFLICLVRCRFESFYILLKARKIINEVRLLVNASFLPFVQLHMKAGNKNLTGHFLQDDKFYLDSDT